jgi:hypothetical protein
MKRSPVLVLLVAAGLAGPAPTQPLSWTNRPAPSAPVPVPVDAGSDVEAIRRQVLQPARPPAPAKPPPLAGSPEAPVVSSGKPDVIRAANLIYAGSKSSVCFSGKFLSSLAKESHIETDPAFTPVRLAADQVYEHPFAVMTGEGAFALLEQERRNLAAYLKRGGFVLASAGCSSPDWDRSFRAELAKAMPEARLKKLPMSHPLFSTMFKIQSIQLKHNGSTQLEALELDGRLVLVYSPEGLNDTSSVSGCCCCGGNEVRNSHEINVNIFAYAIMH